MDEAIKSRLNIRHVRDDFHVHDLDSKSWDKADEVLIDKYWSGEAAPLGRQTEAKLLWSNTALYARFEANQAEPLVMSDKPGLKTKTIRLWDRDVCEIFAAPDRSRPKEYFEFEIAPNGEWIDLAIDCTGEERKTDWDYNSGMQSAAKIGNNNVVMAIKIEWKAFGRTPKTGDIWMGNLFRCVGKDPDRGYLSWQPTETETPEFHVPEKFGEFEFKK